MVPRSPRLGLLGPLLFATPLRVRRLSLAKDTTEHLIVAADAPSQPLASYVDAALDLPLGRASQLCDIGAVYHLPVELFAPFADAYTSPATTGRPRGKDKPPGFRKPHRVLDPAFELGPGDYVRVHPQPRRYLQVWEVDWPRRVVFDADAFLVVDKPAGLPAHAARDNLRENVLEQLRHAYRQEPWAPGLRLPHRLDLDTSGALVVAKSSAACGVIAKVLKAGGVAKTYAARVRREDGAEALEPGRVEHWQQRQHTLPHVFALEGDEGVGKRCLMDILEVDQMSETEANVTIRLITGRTHQIRGQLAALGWPILGDQLYGTRGHAKEGYTCSPFLHLRALSIAFDLQDVHYDVSVAKAYDFG